MVLDKNTEMHVFSNVLEEIFDEFRIDKVVEFPFVII